MSESLSALRRRQKLKRVREQIGKSWFNDEEDDHTLPNSSKSYDPYISDKKSFESLDVMSKSLLHSRRKSRKNKLTEKEKKDADLREGNELIKALYLSGRDVKKEIPSPSSSLSIDESENQNLSSHSNSKHQGEKYKKKGGCATHEIHKQAFARKQSKSELLVSHSLEIQSIKRLQSEIEKENQEILELAKRYSKPKLGKKKSTNILGTNEKDSDPMILKKSDSSGTEKSNPTMPTSLSNTNKVDENREVRAESENEYILRLTQEALEEKIGERRTIKSSYPQTNNTKRKLNTICKAKNPITMMRQKEENKFSIQFFDRRFIEKNYKDNEEEDIWVDRSDDEKLTSNEYMIENRNAEIHGSTKARVERPRRRRKVKSNEDSDNEIEILEEQLKPVFENPKLGPSGELVPLILSSKEKDEEIYSVPASINRYLQEYQREGISFLFSRVRQMNGAILGDDMGTGKTVQVIALLAALLKKNGTGKDFLDFKQREALINKKLSNDAFSSIFMGKKLDIEETLSKWVPILIIVPPSIVDNWSKELDKWGHFVFKTFRQDKSEVIKSIKFGLTEILVCGKSFFSMDKFDEICSIRWKLIVVDEFHEYKNSATTAAIGLEELRNSSRCPVIGMTGTLMQNKHKELWNLVDLIQPGLLGSWNEFRVHIVKALKLARTKDAKNDVLQLGEKREHELKTLLKKVFLARTKEEVLKDELTEKTEKVLFCELSEVQKQIYQNILSLPDYELLCMANAPCDCGINQKFFSEYKRMRNKKEQSDYHRKNRRNIVKRKLCCYSTPLIPGTSIINPEAVIWRSMHPNDTPCKKCPTCILLPCFQKLYDLCSHPSMLQVDPLNRSVDNTFVNSTKSEKLLDFAKVALRKNILPHLPGKSYFRNGGIMDNHMELSGKMKSVDTLLHKFQRKRDRVLLFSSSTVTLDIIQQYTKSKGFSFLRLDGQTPTSKRQELVDEYQNNDKIFLFLISTRAGGLGLNITAANKVIIYDVSWNPSSDEQAQDRAFRIGQKRDVDVIRLVASGTIEELKYMRQIYKVHQKTQATEVDKKGTSQKRIFRGVEGEEHRKGELFGLENLLQFKDGSFVLDYIWKTKKKIQSLTNGTYDPKNVAEALHNSEDCDTVAIASGKVSLAPLIGSDSDRCKQAAPVTNESAINLITRNKNAAVDHNDFLQDDKKDTDFTTGVDDLGEELGGETQMVLKAYDKFDESADHSSSIRINESKKSQRNVTKYLKTQKESDLREQSELNFIDKEYENISELKYNHSSTERKIHKEEAQTSNANIRVKHHSLNANFVFMGIPTKSLSSLDFKIHTPDYIAS